MPPLKFCIVAFAAYLFILAFAVSNISGASRIEVLLTGQIEESINPLQNWFKSEPLINYHAVPSRDLRDQLGGNKAMKRFIRIYFPRSYELVRGFDFILLNSPVMSLFEMKQIKWMHDAIAAGSGGLNTASIMSQYPEVYGGWVNSVLQEAFPNDAPGVAEKMGGGTSNVKAFKIEVNERFPEPVLTPFLDLGVENFVGEDSRFVMLRQGAMAIAWQVGNFPRRENVPYIAAWEYEKGRTLTTGDSFGHTFWSSYRGTESDNIYALDMLINIILYGCGRPPAENVEIMHRTRRSFIEYRERMGILMALKDFVEKFGASSARMDQEISEIEGLFQDAAESYLDMDLVSCHESMEEVWKACSRAEALAIELKENALMWVYLIEWLATMSAMMISGFIVWSLMVRRSLYRETGSTRMGA